MSRSVQFNSLAMYCNFFQYYCSYPWLQQLQFFYKLVDGFLTGDCIHMLLPLFGMWLEPCWHSLRVPTTIPDGDWPTESNFLWCYCCCFVLQWRWWQLQSLPPAHPAGSAATARDPNGCRFFLLAGLVSHRSFQGFHIGCWCSCFQKSVAATVHLSFLVAWSRRKNKCLCVW